MVDDRSPHDDLAEAEITTRKGISLIWLVPIVAILVGGWIVYKAYSEKGPIITIEFKEAAGIVADKTVVRYRDVEIGKVIAVDLNAELSGVMVTAELHHGSERLLGEATRLWVEQPEISVTGVRGLQTMLSGVYIGIDPDTDGALRKHFVGLDEAPFITSGEKGRYFVLETPSRGSFSRGAPVMYRGYKVGQIVRDDLAADDKHVDVKIFVEAPYYERITPNTRFWNSSGVDIELSAEGVRVHSKALVSILVGGVSFENPGDGPVGDVAAENARYTLFEDRDKAFEPTYRTVPALLYFDSSVRGLTIGAPVEFRGVRIGQVTDVRLEFAADDFALRIPVYIVIEPERLQIVGHPDEAAIKSRAEGGADNMRRLIDVGMRAQLKTGSLVTGQKLIDFNIFPDLPPATLEFENGVPILPTIPTVLDTITEKIAGILDKLEQLPLEEISQDLRGVLQSARHLIESADVEPALKALTNALNEADVFAKKLNTEIGPRAATTLEQADIFAGRLNSDMAPQLEELLRELKDAARALRVMSDYLERHPEALLKGKTP